MNRPSKGLGSQTNLTSYQGIPRSTTADAPENAGLMAPICSPAEKTAYGCSAKKAMDTLDSIPVSIRIRIGKRVLRLSRQSALNKPFVKRAKEGHGDGSRLQRPLGVC